MEKIKYNIYFLHFYRITMAITPFKDKYYFLSNYYPHPQQWAGYTFRCAEAVYQSCKNPLRRAEFTHLDGITARRLGRKINPPQDWKERRVGLMKEILFDKFSDPELKALLLQTGNEKLIEQNLCYETFWGTVHGVGTNTLGKLLMEIRDKLHD